VHLRGDSLAPGDSVLLEDGCTTCTCSATDGLVDCSSAACGCLGPDGAPLEDGESWSDGCNDCVCSAGLLSCTALACACGSLPPPCEPPRPGCTSTPFCDGVAWYCETVCDPCDPLLIPGECPVPPPECSGGGVVCDPTFGWFCEPVVCPCEGVPKPECYSTFMGCESVAVCDVSFHQYYCEDLCVCDLFLAPYCGPFAQPACDAMSGEWSCAADSFTCGPDVPACETMSMACVGVPLCKPDGSWVCTEECSMCEPMTEPPCPPELPTCVPYPYCGPAGLVCELACF
jgi:hypothetical protein